MNGDEFATNFIKAFDDWPDDETWKKNRFIKFVNENYTEDELDDLWVLAEKSWEKRPSNPVAALNKLKPGKRVALVKHHNEERAHIFYGELPFSTQAGQRFADQLKPIFEIKIAGDSVLPEFLNDEQKATMRSRSSTFMDILMKLMSEPKEGRLV